MTDEKSSLEENPELIIPLSSEQDEITSRSHLSRALTKRAKKNIILVLLGGLLLFILGIIYGPQILVQFSLFVEKDKTVTQTVAEKPIYVAPPVLDPLPSATNSAIVIIEGTSDNAEKVKIYRNGRRIATPTVKSNSSFRTKISLEKGTNEIKAEAIHKTGEESSFSNIQIVVYSEEAPKLTITSPENGKVLKGDESPVTVSGTSENASRITVNGFQAIISGSGNFSYDLPLKPGNNEITVIAIDEAGNKTEQKVSVDYQE